jgi:hypothetical protein
MEDDEVTEGIEAHFSGGIKAFKDEEQKGDRAVEECDRHQINSN